MNNYKVFTIVITLMLCLHFNVLAATTNPGNIQCGHLNIQYHNITVYAPAVAQTESGYKGIISTITTTIQSNGSGRVFVDTLPLTQVDMQGSARLAVQVAGSLVKRDDIHAEDYDYFFVIRTDSPIIGGPSAGAVMTLATICLLENWTIADDIVMTGMINPDGSIGPIGGITHKIDAADSVGANRFLIPSGQMEYTEMVTGNLGSNGWWQTITKPVTRNVSDYATDMYGINVYEVIDINDVLLYATGHTFETYPSENEITTEDYINAMRPLAKSLLSNAEDLFINATNNFDNSSIPNQWPHYYKNQVTDYLNYAESYLYDARELYDKNVFYSSASKSFQSLISSRFVNYACDYFGSEDNDEYIKNLINETQLIYNSKSRIVRNENIRDMISLQCIGIAQKKAVDASTFINNAINNVNNSNEFNGLYQLGYAIERVNSIQWWLNLSNNFNDTNNIDKKTITNLAEESIDNAQQSLVYANVLLEEMGKNQALLTNAEELLEKAHNDLQKGYPAAALFDSLEALLKGNIAIELVDGVSDKKLHRARDRAIISISESRKHGIEPILSLSYFELAENLANESSYENAIFEYKYSDLIAGIVGFTEGSVSSSSRYIGIPDLENSNEENNQSFIHLENSTLLNSYVFLIGAFALGMIIGILIRRNHSQKI